MGGPRGYTQILSIFGIAAFGMRDASRMYEVDSALGRRGKGRPRKTWEECVMHDLHQLGLSRESALERVEWRGLIGGKHPTRAERGQSDVKRR